MRMDDRLASRSSFFALGLSVIALGWPGATTDAARAGKQSGRLASAGQTALPVPKVEPAKPDAAATNRIQQNYGRLPLSFEKNEGQSDPRVEFISRGPGYTMFLTRGGEAVIALSSTSVRVGDAVPAVMSSSKRDPRAMHPRSRETMGRKPPADARAVLRLKLAGANRKIRAAGGEELPGKINYLRGKNRSQWVTGISTYARVAYKNVYPGVDLAYYGNQRQLEYDLIVHPGADPRAIAIDVEGADRLELDAEGDLLMHVAGGQVRQRKPVVYQEINGLRTAIDSRYRLEARHRVRFQLAAYDASLPLVIDPTLAYSTYLGGSNFDNSQGVAVDADGSAYVTGYTTSPEFPITVGEVDVRGIDAFVTKLNPEGTGLVYSTYLGGRGDDFGQSVAVDASDSAYVTGYTSSTDFPTMLSYDTEVNGDFDVFVAKLDPKGALTYSTYLGGKSADFGHGVAIDATGNAFVTGYTMSADFPTEGAIDAEFNRDGAAEADAFVAKLDPTGTVLAFSTYLGGAGADVGYGVAVDVDGVYVTGYTMSDDFPTSLTAFQRALSGALDAFVSKLDPSGAKLVYSTYLGGKSEDVGQGLAVDPNGAYVTGYTMSDDFPISSSAFQPKLGGDVDAFVTRFDREATILVYSTYLGGLARDSGEGVAVDGDGNAYVAGSTVSSNFPTTPGAFETNSKESNDAFVTKIGPSGTALIYSTRLGAESYDIAEGVAVDATGSAYVTGFTSSAGFPVTDRAFDTSFNGVADLFVSKITDIGTPATLSLSPPFDTNRAGEEHCVIATVGDAMRSLLPDVTVRFSVTGSHTAGGTDKTDADGTASFCYTGTTAGADRIVAFADTDRDSTQDPGEPDGVATKTYAPAAPAAVVVTPPTGVNSAGEEHCVTATVTDAFANQTPAVDMFFTVSGGNTASGPRTTDANGVAVFCYTGTTAGADTITAFADTDKDTTQDAGEPDGAAKKTYVPAAAASVVVTPPTGVNPAGAEHCVTATVVDAFGNPTPGANVFFTVTGANAPSGSRTTEANGQAVYCYTGTRAGFDTIKAVVDANGNNLPEATEPTGTATKTYTAGAPFALIVSPAAGVGPVDTRHCVIATVTDAFGNAVSGLTVRFLVTGAVDATGAESTNAAGQATFCYLGPPLPGVDAITAYADRNRDNIRDPGEPGGAAARTWALPLTTPLCDVAVTVGGRITARTGDKATFGGNAKSDSSGQVSGQEEYQDHGPAQPMNVKSVKVLALVCDSTGARQTSIYGLATIDGTGSYYYRINVRESPDSETGKDTYWIVLQNGYDSGVQAIEGGNISVR
jgi:hypothetical protein